MLAASRHMGCAFSQGERRSSAVREAPCKVCFACKGSAGAPAAGICAGSPASHFTIWHFCHWGVSCRQQGSQNPCKENILSLMDQRGACVPTSLQRAEAWGVYSIQGPNKSFPHHLKTDCSQGRVPSWYWQYLSARPSLRASGRGFSTAAVLPSASLSSLRRTLARSPH